MTKRDGYRLKDPKASDGKTLSEVSMLLKISIQKCSRLIQKLGLPVSKLGYIVLIHPAEIKLLRKALRQKKKAMPN